MVKNLTACRWLYSALLCLLLLLLGWQISTSHWLQTDLRTLLPKTDRWSPLQLDAEQKQSDQLNRQLIALVGHSDSATAFRLAEQLSQQWQASGQFSQIIHQATPNIAALRQHVQQLRIALLPTSIRQQLLNTPKAYFQQYAEQLTNPFEPNLLPLESDWLGLGRFTLTHTQPQSQIQWQPDNGMLFADFQGKTWVLLQAALPAQDLITPDISLQTLLANNQTWVHAEQGELLATGAVLFAEQAKQIAEKESSLMSLFGLSLTLLLLLGVFRTWRVLWLFLPIVIGMLSGIAVTVLFFGQIHLLTLVIGTSLIGVLIDFPLHWFSASLANPTWRSHHTMKKLRLTFAVSLFVTLLGYGLLGFTALPVLQQTALFSAVALVMALLATQLYLPLIFLRYRPCKRSDSDKKFPIWQAMLAQINQKIQRLPAGFRKAALTLGVIFIGLGIVRSKWQDDIRQWVALPKPLLTQAQQIAQITGIDLSSQHFLLVADDDAALLALDSQLSQQLAVLQQQGQFRHFQSLSQWAMSPDEQAKWVTAVSERIQPEDYAPLIDLGIPQTGITQALKDLKNAPLVSLSDALNSPLGKGWAMLYLGQMSAAPSKVASIIKIAGVAADHQLEQLADNHAIFWQDKPASLNQAFQQTRNQAAWLKLLSFGIAGLFLWRIFGAQKSRTMLAIPLAAIAITIGLLGWLGQSIGLFTLFGLLLVSAISIDYIAYMQTADEPITRKRTAIKLAAATTLISFTLLGLSSTPAVASFGLSVSLGVIISVIITFRVIRSN